MPNKKLEVQKIKAIAFDLFGMLAFIHNRTNPLDFFLEQISVGRARQKVLVKLAMTHDIADLLNLPEVAQKPVQANFSKFLYLISREVDSTMLYPETANVLINLRQRGYDLGIVANLPLPYKKAVYKLKLDHLLDFSVFSCDVGCCKPDMAIFHKACAAAMLPPEDMLTISTKPGDLTIPRTLGMQTLTLKRGERHAKPGVISSLTDLLELLPARN